MARKPIAKALPRGPIVHDYELPQARNLITTTPNAHGEILDWCAGAIVRLKAQVGDSDEEIVRAKDSLEAVALRVVVIPAPKAAATVPMVVAKPTARTAREAAIALVEESAFHDKPSLRSMVEGLLAEQGL